jgi:hypothetical protein
VGSNGLFIGLSFEDLILCEIVGGVITKKPQKMNDQRERVWYLQFIVIEVFVD